ncbi:hypothetical protein NQ318_009622 [Aromia moschata]|uniref:Uncharacterized protein n=1 Tax=Aromia moschata TaxID=1265417 RepID=A0AAV8Y7Q4_9CUCU|nr:hypothetical protein NQ318_009622 [Aromia moschata]
MEQIISPPIGLVLMPRSHFTVALKGFSVHTPETVLHNRLGTTLEADPETNVRNPEPGDTYRGSPESPGHFHGGGNSTAGAVV